MPDSPLAILAALAVLCGLSQWLAWRLRLPSILFLLVVGIVIGPGIGWLDTDALLGNALFPFVSVAVAIILFEGGLTLKFSDIRGHGNVVTLLISIGLLITWILMAIAAHWIFSLSWPLALVFGSIVTVSGPTVVKPILRTVRPTDRGSVLGAAGGYALSVVLRKYLVPDFLINAITLIAVVVVFAIAESLQHESGLLAVTLMGVWLANAKGLHIEDILHFKEDLSLLLISMLFILLGARLDLPLGLLHYGGPILLLLATAQFIIRPLNAWVCTLGSELSTRERFFIGWIHPRGIVAAAVSSLFALRLAEADVAQAELLVPMTFGIIIGTVVFQSLTAKALAGKLDIRNPAPNGVLFLGAGDIALQLAAALRDNSIKVVVADTVWGKIRRARQLGLETYHGNPTSGHAEEHLELQGIGKLLAVSSNRDANALAGMHFKGEFGSDAVYALESASDDQAYQRFDTANRNRSNALFDASLSRDKLKRLLREGEILSLSLTDDASGSPSDVSSEEQEATESPTATKSTTTQQTAQEVQTDEVEQSETANETTNAKDGVGSLIHDTDLKLFAVDREGTLHIFKDQNSLKPKTGWQVVVLRPKETKSS